MQAIDALPDDVFIFPTQQEERGSAVQEIMFAGTLPNEMETVTGVCSSAVTEHCPRSTHYYQNGFRKRGLPGDRFPGQK